MKNKLYSVAITLLAFMASLPATAGVTNINDLKDGVVVATDRIEIERKPPVVLPQGRTWSVLKRVEMILTGYRFVRVTLMNQTENDPIQLLTFGVFVDSVRYGSPDPEACIQIPNTLTQGYAYLGSSTFGCSKVQVMRDLSSKIPDLLKDVQNQYSYGLLDGVLKPLASNSQVLARLGKHPIFATLKTIRFGTQSMNYTVVIKNDTEYQPGNDTVLDGRLDAWVRDYFKFVALHIKEEPVIPAPTLPFPDITTFHQTNVLHEPVPIGLEMPAGIESKVKWLPKVVAYRPWSEGSGLNRVIMSKVEDSSEAPAKDALFMLWGSWFLADLGAGEVTRYSTYRAGPGGIRFRVIDSEYFADYPRVVAK